MTVRPAPARSIVRRVTAAAMMVASTLFLLARPASADSVGSAAGYGVQLLAQTPWVKNSGQLALRVSVSAQTPASDQLEVRYFPQLITRTNFDSAASGKVRSYPSYTGRQPLSKFPADPAGGIDVNIPVDSPAPPGSPFAAFSTGAVGSAVFPVQLSVVDASGVEEGQPLTTFLVYASGTVTPLSVALVIPVGGAPAVSGAGKLTGPTSSEAGRLSRLAAALGADHSVPASVLSLPRSLAALQVGAAAGSAADRSTLTGLSGVPQGGLIQVLPSTYSPVTPGDLVGAGLAGEADQQVAAGATVLRSVFGAAPDPATWVVDGPLDSATAGFLAAHHATSLIVPNSDLTTYNSRVTFASATWLQSGDTRLKVLAADPQLSADFGTDQPPALAANHLLAELAMIQTEQPSNARGVVAMPPPGASVSPDLVSTLLAGLNGNPLVRPVTASGLFQALPAPQVTRQLADPQPAPGRAAAALVASARAIQAARQDIAGLSSLLSDQAQLVTMGDQLLTAESEDILPSTRRALLGSIEAAKNRFTRRISLPGSTTITLTATKGQLPLTILSAGAVHARVQLDLTSQRLIFRPASLPGGSCRVPVPTKEICTFSLQAQNTTLHVPVETRSSGVFPLEVDLRSANGMLALARNRDTVRSTAVSGVGLVLIVVAVLSLAVWWVRDLRHGRRPRELAPAPDSEEAAEVELSDDPAVHEFFNSDPPQFDNSGRRTG